jgi:glycyl-tRNA synthetase alpha chain
MTVEDPTRPAAEPTTHEVRDAEPMLAEDAGERAEARQPEPSEPPTFQDIAARLIAFWSNRACVVVPPFDVEIGAATMSPQTFFRALGGQPWRGAQLQSVRRPWDGRYGRNPLRLARHSQFEVLLKPPDEDAFDVYLESLRFIGLRLDQHDLQLRESEWEVQVLGVEGQGWRVRLDGVPVTHFTYLQRVGSRALESVALEITYGVERLALVAQGARSIDALQWRDGVSYAEVRRFQEEDLSTYYNEVASIERLQAAYVATEEEAESCLERGLVIPAYEALLRCSHAFQILRRRGAIDSVRESEVRTQLRDLASRCADLWSERCDAAAEP